MIPIDFLTMATSFMLNPNITLNPLTHQYSIIKRSLIKPFAKSPNFPWLITNPRVTLKCSVSNENLNKPVSKPFKRENKRDPYEVFANAVLKSLKTLQETNVALVLFIAVAFMSFSQNSALAAGGGRMEGRSFLSKTSSTPKNSPSRSSSYTSSPSRSSSYKNSPSKSSSYKTRSSHGSSSSIWYSPSHSVRNMFRYNGSDYCGHSDNSSKTLVESIRVGTGTPQKISPWSGTQIIIAALSVLCILRVIFCYASNNSSSLSERISVLKLQVCLLGSTRSLQKELNKIAETADRSTKEGLTSILTETTRVLLQHIDYCISGYSSVNASTEMKDGEKTLSSLSSEESSKFYKEILLNVLNREKPSLSSKESTGFNNEYIMVTILVLVVADKEHKLPRVSSSKDLKEALKMLGSLPTDQTLSVEIYWAPQEENGNLTEKDLLRNYPLLRLCKKHNLGTY